MHSNATTDEGRPSRRLPALIVAFFLSTFLFAVLAPSASALPPNFFGLMPAGPQVHTESDLEAAARSGAKYWRIGFNCFEWYENKENVWKSNWDDQVELAWKHGLQTLPTIESRCKQVSGDIPHEDEWGTWDEFVKVLVAHYGYNGSFWQGKENKKEIENWEIQNEPNLSAAGINEYANGYTYARLFQRTSEDLHADQGNFFPTRAIFGGMLYGIIDTSGLKTQTPHDFMQAAAAYTSVKPWIDGVAIHPYEFGENAVPRSEADVNEARSDVNNFFGAGKSLWITEVGWPAEKHGEPPDYPETTLASQADALKHLFDWVKLEQFGKNIQSLIFYMYRDFDWSHKWDSYSGLREIAEGTDRYAKPTFRPAWYAYQEETSAAKWPVAPGAETMAATSVATTSATLNGTINPHGLPTGYHFEWAKGSEGFSHWLPAQDTEAGWKEGTVTVSQVLTGLEPGTTYHFRVVGVNENHELAGGANLAVTTLPPPTVIGLVTTDDHFFAKEGSLSAPWTQEGEGVQSIAVASDPTNGPLIAELKSDGHFFVKQGSLGAPWTQEGEGIKSIAVASDPTNGPLIAELRNDGSFFVKQGSLSAPWTLEGEGVQSIAVASDPIHGSLVAELKSDGGFFVKQGSLSAPWTQESAEVKAISIASDPVNGPLIAQLKSDGTFYAKQGSLGGAWTQESAGVQSIAVASNSPNGPLIGQLKSDGHFYAKQGSLGAGWIEESSVARIFALAR